jgi:NADH dehydrogenase FAD-containing subunit
VLGAGIAGLFFTLRLAGKVAGTDVEITLVNERDTFIVRPWLHEFATGQRVFHRSLTRILRKSQVRFIQGRVVSLDPDQKRVLVQGERQEHVLVYDRLVYALGSMTEHQRVPGVDQYTYRLSPDGPYSASSLREKLPLIQAEGGHVVVCGGGATGIETAAQVASVYPHIQVSLVTRGSLAHMWGEKVARIVRRRLERLQVAIIDQSEVLAVHERTVELAGGRELAHTLCIWAAGFVAPSLARETGLDVNERGQIRVDPFLCSLSHPEITAIGDAAIPVVHPGVGHVRMSAYTASIMAAHAADSLQAILTNVEPQPLSFSYQAQAVALGAGNVLFLPLSPDDQPVSPFVTGWFGALVREGVVRFVIAVTMVQRSFPGLFVWPGKDRYVKAQKQTSITKVA